MWDITKKILFILFAFLLACCSSMHKTRSRDFVDSRKTERISKDSVAILLMDSLGVNRKNSLWHWQNDLNYERVIEEEIEYLPQNIAKVQIKRRIIERGVNTSIGQGQTNSEDSAHRNTSAQWSNKEKRELDSAGSARKTITTKKKTGLQWYVWVIAIILTGGIIWWKGKEKILRFFN